MFPNLPTDGGPQSGAPKPSRDQWGPCSQPELQNRSSPVCSWPCRTGVPGPPRSSSNPTPPTLQWAYPDPPALGKGSLEGLTQPGCKSVGWRHLFQPSGHRAATSGSQDPSRGVSLPSGQDSRRVSGSWSHPGRNKAWSVPQVKAGLGPHPQTGIGAIRSRGDRVRHSPSLRSGSDQEGAELRGWWQWCHSRVPCVTLCGPDAACKREAGGRGSRGSFPGTAGVTGGCPCCPPWCWWLSHVHPPPTQPRAGTGSLAAEGGGAWGRGSSPQAWPSPRRWWGSAPTYTALDPQTLPTPLLGSPPGDQMASPSAPRGARDGGQPGAPGPERGVGAKVTLLMAASPFLPFPFPLPPTWGPAPRHSSFRGVAVLW